MKVKEREIPSHEEQRRGYEEVKRAEWERQAWRLKAH